jgi:2'-5' RNA ligase
MSIKRSGFNQYFIAIVPPSPIYEEALKWKNYFKDRYNSKAALNSPPHITLHMPFEWKTEKEGRLVEQLGAFLNEKERVKINFQGFDCFEPRVVFLKVEKTAELTVLQKELESFCKITFQLFNAQYRNLPFHPHLTLAFRDLKKASFEAAWEDFSQRKFSEQFLADRITLLKHNGKTWDTFKEFSLA